MLTQQKPTRSKQWAPSLPNLGALKWHFSQPWLGSPVTPWGWRTAGLWLGGASGVKPAQSGGDLPLSGSQTHEKRVFLRPQSRICSLKRQLDARLSKLSCASSPDPLTFFFLPVWKNCKPGVGRTNRGETCGPIPSSTFNEPSRHRRVKLQVEPEPALTAPNSWRQESPVDGSPDPQLLRWGGGGGMKVFVVLWASGQLQLVAFCTDWLVTWRVIAHWLWFWWAPQEVSALKKHFYFMKYCYSLFYFILKG